jgi:uncharacterized protein
MNFETLDKAALVLEAYVRLRGSGFQLGVDEYMTGLKLVSDRAQSLPFVNDLDGLKQSLKMIWCSSRSEQGQFEPIWDKAIAALESSSQVVIEEDTREPMALPDREPTVPQRIAPEKTLPASVESSSQALDATAQPVRSPFTPAEIDRPSDLQSYWPVSRRSLSYSWRYLRRNVPEGPAETVDVAATVQQSAQQGFYLEPVMQQSYYNRAQLLLFIDQNGSMMPIHQFTREIVETALYESNFPEGQVMVCYYQNFPADYVYKDIFLTEPTELAALLAGCDDDTSVLIVSDGGAARGYRHLERIRKTTRFLRRLRQTTQLCAWLNPVPQERWEGSSAEIIANLVPMFQMDDDGLSNAIDVVRGLQMQLL